MSEQFRELALFPFAQRDFFSIPYPSLITRKNIRLKRKQKKWIYEQSEPITHFLCQGLLQSCQGSIGVGGISLQGFDSFFQAAHLLFLISKLLLKIFNLSVHIHLRKKKEIKTVTIRIILSWKQINQGCCECVACRNNLMLKISEL